MSGNSSFEETFIPSKKSEVFGLFSLLTGIILLIGGILDAHFSLDSQITTFTNYDGSILINQETIFWRQIIQQTAENSYIFHPSLIGIIILSLIPLFIGVGMRYYFQTLRINNKRKNSAKSIIIISIIGEIFILLLILREKIVIPRLANPKYDVLIYTIIFVLIIGYIWIILLGNKVPKNSSDSFRISFYIISSLVIMIIMIIFISVSYNIPD